MKCRCPNGFRDWFVVNSIIVTKDSPIFDQLGGMHIIYVNSMGMSTLKSGGPLPYPDGTEANCLASNPRKEPTKRATTT